MQRIDHHNLLILIASKSSKKSKCLNLDQEQGRPVVATNLNKNKNQKVKNRLQSIEAAMWQQQASTLDRAKKLVATIVPW